MPTLLVYMLVFAATIACTFGAEWQLKYAAEYQPKPTSLKIVRSVASSNRYLLVVFTALAIFIPSLLAGLRADTVGVDVLVYAKPAFDAAVASENFLSFTQTFRHGTRELEIGYMLLVWLCSRISNQVQVLLFATQLLVVGFFYAAFYAYRKYLCIWMSMSIFLCLFYCTSYNLMRQAIAMAIVMYATSYLLRKKYLIYIALVLLASAFHYPALMMLGFLLLWLIFGADIKEWKLMALAGAGIVALVFWQEIMNVIVSLDVIPAYYTKYINGEVSFQASLFFRHVSYLAIEIFAFRKTQNKNKVYSFFFLIVLMLTVGCYVATSYENAYRVIEYVAIFRVFTLSMIYEAEDRPYWKFAYLAFIYLRIAIFFGKHYCLVTSHDAFPYIPFWQ